MQGAGRMTKRWLAWVALAAGVFGSASARAEDTELEMLGAAPVPWVRGRVVGVSGDRAIVELDDALDVGARVDFYRPGEDMPRVVARGFVESAGVTRGVRVQLEPNTRVEEGMTLRSTPDRGGGWMMPPLALGTGQLGLHGRLYIPLSASVGLGVLGDLLAGYLVDLDGQNGLRLALRVDQIGGVIGPNPAPFSGLGHGQVSFASSYFELGVGVGLSVVNGESVWVGDRFRNDRQLAVSFSQQLRIGSEDGLSLRLASSVVIVGRPGTERWSFGDLYADGRIPLGHGVALVVRGGGGFSGLFSWDAGARIRLSGTGLSGSTFLTVAGGVGFVNIDGFSSAGPLVGVGVEHRL